MNKTTNIKRGQIWFNLLTSEPIRITTILPCRGVWGVNAADEGYGETIKFEDIRKASVDEVLDFRDDRRVWKGDALALDS
jgi:hypothetical protein|tara:strand:- start:164 stop:403 length:240 start_codon:yes stop_codon:yes gene_type:complete